MPYINPTSPQKGQNHTTNQAPGSEASSTANPVAQNDLFGAATVTNSDTRGRLLPKLPSDGGLGVTQAQQSTGALKSREANITPFYAVVSNQDEEMKKDQIPVLVYLKFKRRSGDEDVINSIKKQVREIGAKLNDDSASQSKEERIEIWDGRYLKTFSLNNEQFKELVLWFNENEKFKELAGIHQIDRKIESFLDENILKIYNLVSSKPNKVERAAALSEIILAINSIFQGKKEFSAIKDQVIINELEKLAKALTNFSAHCQNSDGLKNALEDYLIQMNTDLILNVNALKLVEQAIAKVKANINLVDRIKRFFANSNEDRKYVFQLTRHGIASILGNDEPEIDEKVRELKFSSQEVDDILKENFNQIGVKVKLARIFDLRLKTLESAIMPLLSKKLSSLEAES